MHRQDGAGFRARIKFLEMWRRHLLEAVRELDLTHHGQPVTTFYLLGDPRLLKKGDVHDAGVVDKGDLGNREVGTWMLLQHPIDHGDDRADRPDGRGFDGMGMAEI